MLVVDDIILFPVKSIFWIFKQIHKAVEEEQGQEVENITRQLSELYMMLETGQISEEEFDEQEEVLLDRLDELEPDDDLDDDMDDDEDEQ